MRRLCLLLFSLFFLGVAGAQQFGGAPPRTNWQQINTDTARVIFESGSEKKAAEVAAIIHAMAVRNVYGAHLKKVNIVLHSNTTEANGYVALAPFRSEYYLMPGADPFETGNLPWHKLLAIHEYRHVAQYNAFNNGLTKAFSAVLGEEGRALANAFAVPDWFFEGDAVYAETALSPQGRGRMPYFFKGFESLWKEGKEYSWMKLRNGSVKDFVPNHYPLGYLLVNWGYANYGANFWQKVTKDASAFKCIIYPFQKAVKKHSGERFRAFRTKAFAYYRGTAESDKNIQKRVGEVINYLYPQQIGADSLLYLKSSYEKAPKFILKVAGKERAIAPQSITSNDWFSYRNGLVAYTAFATNARWSLNNYSNIVLLDLATGKEKKLTKKGYYFSPDISPNGQQIIAVSIKDSLQNNLQLLTSSGAFLKGFAPPHDAEFFQPRFINDSAIVVGIKHPDAAVSWNEIDLKNGLLTNLLPQTSATIGFPFVHNGFLYFTSSASGSDNNYALQLNTKKLWQLTSDGTGNYFPSVYNNTLYYSAFTSNGYKLQSTLLTNLFANAAAVEAAKAAVPFPVANSESNHFLSLDTNRSFLVTDYKKSSGLLNVHSWRPFYEAPEYSFSVYSNNVLNTFSADAFYRYNEAERSHAVGVNGSYGGFFTVLNGGLTYTADRHLKTASSLRTYNSAEARIGFSVPLNFTAGKTYKYFNGGTNLVFNTLIPTGQTKQITTTSTNTYLHHFLNWRQQVPMVKKKIYPQGGYALSAAYRHQTSKKGYQSLLSSQVYLPSFFQTHSIVLGANIQQTDTANVLFSNRFAFSRGYPTIYFSRMWRGSGNYHFPLLYPDKGVAEIVYLLRVRANLFYDYTRTFSKNKKTNYDFRSLGTEVFFDTKWWNQLPVSFGVRYSYLLDAKSANLKNPNRFEFILPVNLLSN